MEVDERTTAVLVTVVLDGVAEEPALPELELAEIPLVEEAAGGTAVWATLVLLVVAGLL